MASLSAIGLIYCDVIKMEKLRLIFFLCIFTWKFVSEIWCQDIIYYLLYIFSPDVKTFLSLDNPRNVPDKSDSESFDDYDAMVGTPDPMNVCRC